jgi:hypothetical protein
VTLEASLRRQPKGDRCRLGRARDVSGEFEAVHAHHPVGLVRRHQVGRQLIEEGERRSGSVDVGDGGGAGDPEQSRGT